MTQSGSVKVVGRTSVSNVTISISHAQKNNVHSIVYETVLTGEDVFLDIFRYCYALFRDLWLHITFSLFPEDFPPMGVINFLYFP